MNSVKLKAQINPRSETNKAPSKYRFQFARYATMNNCPQNNYEEVPSSTRQITANFKMHTMKLKLSRQLPKHRPGSTNYGTHRPTIRLKHMQTPAHRWRAAQMPV